MPGSQIVQWERIKTSKAKIRRARLISEPGTGYGNTDLRNKAKLYSRSSFGIARCRVIRIPDRSRRIMLA